MIIYNYKQSSIDIKQVIKDYFFDLQLEQISNKKNSPLQEYSKNLL